MTLGTDLYICQNVDNLAAWMPGAMKKVTLDWRSSGAADGRV